LVVAPCAEHQRQGLQVHQARPDDDGDPHPPEVPRGAGLTGFAVQVRVDDAHQLLHRFDHNAALIDACSARSDDRSAFTSSTRIPSNGSSRPAARSPISICRLSTWYARHSAPTSTSCGVPKIRDDTSENRGSPCSSSSKMPPPLSLDTTMVRCGGVGSVGPINNPELSWTNVRSPISATVRAPPAG